MSGERRATTADQDSGTAGQRETYTAQQVVLQLEFPCRGTSGLDGLEHLEMASSCGFSIYCFTDKRRGGWWVKNSTHFDRFGHDLGAAVITTKDDDIVC